MKYLSEQCQIPARGIPRRLQNSDRRTVCWVFRIHFCRFIDKEWPITAEFSQFAKSAPLVPVACLGTSRH